VRGVSNALELRGLTKRYDDGLLALDAVDLVVPAGEFFGLLGPSTSTASSTSRRRSPTTPTRSRTST
jgi:ABC-type multidrug transport system ATPase subunit